MNEGLDCLCSRKLGKIGLNGIAGLVGLHKNRYIPANLWFSYDRVLRVGPSGPALFYYLNEPRLLAEQALGTGTADLALPADWPGPSIGETEREDRRSKGKT